jgi:hypothetical protein
MDELPSRSITAPSWGGKRPLAALVIAFGIYTFFTPLVILKTPVLGRTEWSAFHMALEVRNDRLPADRHWIELNAVEDTLVYLLLLAALMLLVLPRGQKPLYHVGLVGLIISVLAMRNATRHFSDFVTGSPGIYWNGGASLGPAVYCSRSRCSRFSCWLGAPELQVSLSLASSANPSRTA